MTSRVGDIPVVNEDGRLVGIVSRTDLLGVYDRPDRDAVAVSLLDAVRRVDGVVIVRDRLSYQHGQ